MSMPRERNAQKTFDNLCDSAIKCIDSNEPLPVTLDAILLGYIGFLPIGLIVEDKHYKELKTKIDSCENAALLMPSVYAAIEDVTSYDAVNSAYPEPRQVNAWA